MKNNNMCHLILLFGLCLFQRINAQSSSIVDELQVQLLSPVNNAHYLANSGEIYTHIEVLAVNPQLVKSMSFSTCVTFYELEEYPAASSHQGIPSTSSRRRGQALHSQCKSMSSPDQTLPSFAIYSHKSGYYSVEVVLFDVNEPQHNISDSVRFQIGRKVFKQAVLAKAPQVPHLSKASDKSKHGTKIPHHSSSRNRAMQQKDVIVAAVKYGHQGDDTSISVAINGRVIVRIPLDTAFLIDVEEYRLKLTQSQNSQKNRHHSFDLQDNQRLSQHLALQTVSGFVSGCGGLFVRTTGVTEICNDPNLVRQNWIGVKNRIQEAVSLLWDNGSIEYDSNGDILFDAVVFVAGEADARFVENEALYHVKQVFIHKQFAIDDDTQAPGDTALIVWADYHELIDNNDDASDHGDVFLQESVSSHGLNHDDIMSPKVVGLTVDATSFLRKKMRDIRGKNQHTTICRPGLGWDTTLAHRHLKYSQDKISSIEVALLRENTGVGLVSVNTSNDVSDGRAYFDIWNEVYLDYCDSIAVFPATVGRMKEYCQLGLKPKRGDKKGQIPRRCETFDARMLNGYPQLNNMDTWFSELRGLRVLIIHPFGKSIQSQYEKHLRLLQQGRVGGLFPHNPNALPIFKELMLLSPPLGNIGKLWHEAIEDFLTELEQLPSTFDIALISCGAWGPLIQGIIREKYGKSSIYMGGALQLHFGIWGGRYKNVAVLKAIAKSSQEWVWPLVNETQKLRETIVISGDYASPM